MFKSLKLAPNLQIKFVLELQ